MPPIPKPLMELHSIHLKAKSAVLRRQEAPRSITFALAYGLPALSTLEAEEQTAAVNPRAAMSRATKPEKKDIVPHCGPDEKRQMNIRTPCKTKLPSQVPTCLGSNFVKVNRLNLFAPWEMNYDFQSTALVTLDSVTSPH